MSRNYGYSEKGKRAFEYRCSKPQKSDRLTIIGALSLSGIFGVWEINGSLTTESFILNQVNNQLKDSSIYL